MSDILVQQQSTITEQFIIDILDKKHTDDIFVAHCKTGPSQGGKGTPILDAWVMPRSWVKPIIGYEIKVSRQDFRRDRKWIKYLEFCNLFYFVTPWSLIYPNEVPAEAGLIWITKTGAGIRYQKKAPSRWWHNIPQGIFMYVLMWRTTQNTIKEAERLKEEEHEQRDSGKTEKA